MIIITGATGKLGSQIVEKLLMRLPAEEVGVSVRNPEHAANLAARGVRVRRGDFSDPRTLTDAFEGASRVLIVSSNESGASAVDQHKAAIDAAYLAGAGQVMYTSHQGAASDSLFAPMRDHAATERYLLEQGQTFTSLRNGFYASTVPLLIGQALATGTIAAPADGAVSWTAHEDLAEVAALALTDAGSLDGVSAPLTASAALDLQAVAGILSDLTGRTISRAVIDDDQWKAGLIAHGVPEAQADFSLSIFRASRRGEFAATDRALENLCGRPATPLRSALAATIAESEAA
ncbi:MAG TPA: NAD(P)H-binding protein [Microbacteriaceae bacterium]|nr:NAD(P)H-binding protein [Microbacteriaceae bacterium]